MPATQAGGTPEAVAERAGMISSARNHVVDEARLALQV